MCEERLQFTIRNSDGNEIEYVFTIAELQSMYLAGNLEIRKTDKVVKCLAGNIQLYIENFGELIKILGIDNDSHIASIRDMFKKYSLDELEQMYTKEQIITKFFVPVYGFRPLSTHNKHRILHEIYMLFYNKDRATALLDSFD